MGRPKIELDIAQIEALAGRGLTRAEICGVLDISIETLKRRKRDDANVAAAMLRGRSRAAAIVANVIFEAAKGGNIKAAVWFEKTRRGITEHTALLERIETLEKAAGIQE